MIKTRIIKKETVEQALEIFGKNNVDKVFDLIRKKIPIIVSEELDDENLKECLLYLFGGNLEM